MEVSRQEYWRGLSFPSPGDLSDPGSKLRSLALQAGFYFFFFPPAEPPGKPVFSAHLKPTQYGESTKTLQLLKLTRKKRERKRKGKEKGRKKEKSCLQERRGEQGYPGTGGGSRLPSPGKPVRFGCAVTPTEAGCVGCPHPAGPSWPGREPHLPPAHPFPAGAGVFLPDGSAVSAETTSLTKLPPGLARVRRVLRGTPPRVRGGPQWTRTRGRSSLDGDRLRGGGPPVAAPPQAARAAPVPHTRGLPSSSRPAGPCSRPRHPRGPRRLGRASGVLALPGGALSVTPASAVCVCVHARVPAAQLSLPSHQPRLPWWLSR